jgi:hypothetical protein
LRFFTAISRSLAAALACAVAQPVLAADQNSGIPAWLQAHVGEGDGQIAAPVLTKARALYLQKVREGKVHNSCYFAMDATRPNTAAGRFYIICEGEQQFRIIASGHGSGRNLPGAANFQNDRTCARNFGNAADSDLTAGGAYVTSEQKTSFKGYYRAPKNHVAMLSRTFVQFEGEGETANARQRAIGGHAAVTLKGVCMRKAPGDSHANKDGLVPFGNLVDYAGGRSNGCTSWSQPDASMIMGMVKSAPTTLYIYPDSSVVKSVEQAVQSGRSPGQAGLYWNASCLKAIGKPHYWSKDILEPLIVKYWHDHPGPPPKPTPMCTGEDATPIRKDIVSR